MKVLNQIIENQVQIFIWLYSRLQKKSIIQKANKIDNGPSHFDSHERILFHGVSQNVPKVLVC